MDSFIHFFLKIIDFFLHLDKYLDIIIKSAGIWSYVLLFLVIFCETGLVVTPFLPGDSLLFAIGAFAAIGSFNIWIILPLLCVAAILGDTVNYWIGYKIGPKVFHFEKSKLFKKEHLEKAHKFYEKHGGKTIIIARFIPIIRTFAPFVAGIGTMSYPRFIAYNIIGGISWVSIFMLSGYFFGNIPQVKKNFTVVILIIILISITPIVMEFIKAKKQKK